MRGNEISGKDQVMREMKVYKMKNRKESKSVGIKGKFSCRRHEHGKTEKGTNV